MINGGAVELRLLKELKMKGKNYVSFLLHYFQGILVSSLSFYLLMTPVGPFASNKSVVFIFAEFSHIYFQLIVKDNMAKRVSNSGENVEILDSDYELESDSDCEPVNLFNPFSSIDAVAAGPSSTNTAAASISDEVSEIVADEIIIEEILPDSWISGPFVPIVYDFTDTNHGINQSTNLTGDSSILDFFVHFMNSELMIKIVEYTNIYQRHIKLTKQFVDKSRIHKWRDTTVDEMYIFYAVCLLMTRNRHLTIEEHWSTDPLLRSPAFGQIMKRDRFELILQMLHYCDVESPIYGDRLYKIRALIDHCRNIFRNTFSPNKNLCIDESIIVFKGRLLFKQYIPSKRHRFGIKMFVLCDVETGYIIDFIIYCGDGTDITDSGQLGVSGAVVTTLLSEYFGKGHTLWCDNWYTSPNLFKYLHDRSTNACGTVRSNRKNLPKFKKLKKGEMETQCKGPLLAIKWHDRREVHILTTLHTEEKEATGKTNRMTGEPILKPKAVIDYNKNMGSVDKSDMMLSSVSCMRKSTKWYKKVGLHIIDLFMLNAFYLHQHVTRQKMGIAEFQLSVIRQLIEKFSVTDFSNSSENPRRAATIKKEILEHMPQIIPPVDQSKKPIYRRCKMCYDAKRRKETKLMCVKCNVALCDYPCFYEYHKQ